MKTFFKKMLSILLTCILFIWQLPQIILGFIVLCVYRRKYSVHKSVYSTENCKPFSYHKIYNYNNGVSLSSKFIILGDSRCIKRTLLHEHGHAFQSKVLGPLYLILIGLPSASGNIFDRVFHKKWEPQKRIKWYYNLPWEHWADLVYGVKR